VWVERVGERRVSGLGEGRNVGKEGKVWRRGNDVVQGNRTPYPHMIKEIWSWYTSLTQSIETV